MDCAGCQPRNDHPVPQGMWFPVRGGLFGLLCRSFLQKPRWQRQSDGAALRIRLASVRNAARLDWKYMPDTALPWPDRKLMALLRRLAIYPTAAQRSARFVGQRSNRRGVSMEPADSRAYVQGDDLRHLDWGQLAKFDQLVVRLFYAQRALRVAIALDCSASMTLGRPRKFDMARSLAACLGIIALHGRNELTLVTAPASAPAQRIADLADSHFIMADMLTKLRSLEAGGELDLPALLTMSTRKPADLLIVISDCLPPQDLTRAFAAVAAGGTRLIVLHTLSPEELRPPFLQPVTLRDPETSRRRDVSGGKSAHDAYITALRRWRSELSQSVRSCGGIYIDILTSQDIEEILTHHFSGVLVAQ